MIKLSQSNIFMDAGGDGLLHRTAWAGAGDAVLFYDPDNLGEITVKRQYVFTEWDPISNRLHGSVVKCGQNPLFDSVGLM